MKSFFYKLLFLLTTIQLSYAKTDSCEDAWRKYENDWMSKCLKEKVEYGPNQYLEMTQWQCQRMLRYSIIQMKFEVLPDEIYQYLRDAGQAKDFVKFLKSHRVGKTKDYSIKALDNLAFRISTTKDAYLKMKKELEK